MFGRIQNFQNCGYRVTDTEVSYVIAWRQKEETDEVAVCLANFILTRESTS